MISKDDIIKAKKMVWSSPKVKLFIFLKLYCIYLFSCVGRVLVGAHRILVASCRLFSLWHTDSGCGMWAWLLHGMWNLSSPARDHICIPCIAGCVFNHWTSELCKLSTFSSSGISLSIFVLSLCQMLVKTLLWTYVWNPFTGPLWNLSFTWKRKFHSLHFLLSTGMF